MIAGLGDMTAQSDLTYVYINTQTFKKNGSVHRGTAPTFPDPMTVAHDDLSATVHFGLSPRLLGEPKWRGLNSVP